MKALEELGPELEGELRAAEEQIQGAYAVQGRALRQIRDQQLYRADGYESFLSYCQGRWEWGREHAYRLIDASDVYEQLATQKVAPPDNEAQAREIAPLLKQGNVTEMAETWVALRKEHGHRLTAAHVRDAVRNLGPPTSKPPKVEPLRVDPPEAPEQEDSDAALLNRLHDDLREEAIRQRPARRVKVFVDVDCLSALRKAAQLLQERE